MLEKTPNPFQHHHKKKKEITELRHGNEEMLNIIPQCDITLVWGLFL